MAVSQMRNVGLGPVYQWRSLIHINVSDNKYKAHSVVMMQLFHHILILTVQAVVMEFGNSNNSWNFYQGNLTKVKPCINKYFLASHYHDK